MSPGVIITAFIVSLVLVFGSKSDKSAKDEKSAQRGPIVFTSVEELTELLDTAGESGVVIVKPVSKQA